MDILKASDTARYIQNFFQGIARFDWVGAEPLKLENLPVWMKHSAQFYQFPLGKIIVALIAPKDTKDFKQVINLYRVFERLNPGPALLLANDLPAKSRGVLVRMGIPHVVSDSAVFAPQLGLAYGKVSETRKSKDVEDRLSPLGLKLIARYLLKKNTVEVNFTLSELQLQLAKENFSFSLSTLSRVFQQLETLQIISVHGGGRSRTLQLKRREDIWGQLTQMQIETFSRKIQMHGQQPKDLAWVYAGELALAKMSDLMEPNEVTIATSLSNYNKWKDKNDLSKIDVDQPSLIIELWKEDPVFLSKKNCLNPIELALSLRRNDDPRIRLAISQMLKELSLDADLLWRPS
jgi:hypothetical protein